MDRSHGSACLHTGPADALFRDLNRHSHRRVTARAHRKRLRDSRRRWILTAGTAPASTPVWTSRDGWLGELAAWARTADGAKALAAVNLRSGLLLRIAEAMASFADHRSGRHCAASNATIAAQAGCSPRSVTTARRVLAGAGWAVEVRRGTGSSATSSHRRRPSLWHLVSRRQPVDNLGVCDLPPSLCDRRLSHVGKNSPSGRARPPRKPSPRTQNREPRPLVLQRMAATLVAGSIGLHTVHPGQICDALARSGLDLTAWTAPQILQGLNTDMRTTGWSWPDHISRPGGFIVSRLRRLPTRPAGTQRRPMSQPEPTTAATRPASAATRAAALEYFHTHRAKSRR